MPQTQEATATTTHNPLSQSYFENPPTIWCSPFSPHPLKREVTMMPLSTSTRWQWTWWLVHQSERLGSKGDGQRQVFASDRLPESDSLALKIGLNRPSHNETSIPTIHFQVRNVSFREGIYFFMIFLLWFFCFIRQAVITVITVICYLVYFIGFLSLEYLWVADSDCGMKWTSAIGGPDLPLELIFELVTCPGQYCTVDAQNFRTHSGMITITITQKAAKIIPPGTWALGIVDHQFWRIYTLVK